MGKSKRKTPHSSTSSPDTETVKRTRTDESSESKSAERQRLEENKAALTKIIKKYKNCVDPLVRFTFDVANTTAGERVDIAKAGHIFIRRSPNTAPGDLPVGFAGVNGLGLYADPGNETCELRFSGAQQVANWIADAQARGYATGAGVVRFTVQLTSDNGRHWSAPFEVLH